MDGSKRRFSIACGGGPTTSILSPRILAFRSSATFTEAAVCQRCCS
jgi:hypothetical protein